MKEQFLPYELSLKLKELGFNEECLVTMHSKTKDIIPIYGVYKENPKYTDFWIKAPLWQQAFDWFREKHNLSIQPFAVWDLDTEEIDFIKNKPSFYITDGFIYNENKSIENSVKFKTYEEARLECLKKLIEIVSNENI